MNDSISEADAYQAMLFFLEYYWKSMNSDDVAVILGAAQLVSEDQSADPAAMDVWREAIRTVKQSS